MAILKCKMCGGDLEVSAEDKVVECEYCGSMQTIVSADNEKKVNLTNRANRLRINCDFDKAAAIYEQIIAEFPDEAEAYWGLCLCNYGIEYVDDPATAMKKPTCHRASFKKLRKDENYELALENADLSQRTVYEDQAKEIDRIMGDILSISKNESPYDIFICYKETDNNGSRTQDSVLAQDIYDSLISKGYKVFFSRITLEDKLGQQYEPYIFAALNSAKVMLVVGTDYEYFNAVWVKNEWSRFLKLMAADKSKTLIPCYLGIDPYDMPEQFKSLQSQDCSKIGYMQDLTRGIEKILGKDKKNENVVIKEIIKSEETNVDSLIDRAFLLIEDGNIEKADEIIEKVLSASPRDYRAYLALLMIEVGAKTVEGLSECEDDFSDSSNFEKAVRFADAEKKAELEKINDSIKERNHKKQQEELYQKALASFNSAHLEKQFLDSKKLFVKLGGYKDSALLAEKCLEKSKEAALEEKYKQAVSLTKSEISSISGKIENFEKASLIFEKIKDYKDSGSKLVYCKKTIEELKSTKEANSKRNKKIAIILGAAAVVLIVIVLIVKNVIIPTSNYNKALSLINEGQYDEGYSILSSLGDFKDSSEQIKLSKYTRAEELFNNKKYEAALDFYTELKDYENSEEQANECVYMIATDLKNNKDYKKAVNKFTKIKSYKDSEDQINSCYYAMASGYFKDKNYEEAATNYSKCSGYKDSDDMYKESNYLLACEYLENKDYDNANPILEDLGNYKDAESRIHYHDYKVTKSVEATCEEDGYDVYYCAGCGDSYNEKTESKTGHNWIDATCTEPKTCSNCGKTKGEALGHTTDSAKCERCGEITFETLIYSGVGFESIENITLPNGDYKVVFYGTSTSNDLNQFYADLYNDGDSKVAYMISHAYPDEPQKSQSTFKVNEEHPMQNGKLTVDAEDNVSWEITIEAY